MEAGPQVLRRRRLLPLQPQSEALRLRDRAVQRQLPVHEPQAEDHAEWNWWVEIS